MQEEPVVFEGVEVLRDTGLAILVEIEGEQYWLPKSQIDDDSEVYEHGTSGTLIISAWLAQQKGLR